MDPPSASPPAGNSNNAAADVVPPSADPTTSTSTSMEQTAAEYIQEQLQLEADARDALPYSIEHCTKALGPLRQSVFSCLTCNPPPADPSGDYNAAGVCYACSVQCHGEHRLVEIFNKRNFTCDCGTTRMPTTSPCNLRVNGTTNTRGGVHSEPADPNNKYNQNFRNRFCGCECDYDPFKQKGTMYQCLGLGTHEEGGCGEDWWHPGCLVGLGPDWFEQTSEYQEEKKTSQLESAEQMEDYEPPPPPGFPSDEDFDGFICYKCVDAFPWIRRYAASPGFLPPVFLDQDKNATNANTTLTAKEADVSDDAAVAAAGEVNLKKRKASDDDDQEDIKGQDAKRQKSDDEETTRTTQNHVVNIKSSELSDAPEAETETETETKTEPKVDVEPELQDLPLCRLPALPPAPEGRFSLFFKEGFREHICRCASCFPLLVPHPQLLEEEETYEPPVSEDGGGDGDGDAGSENGSTLGSGNGSLLERGESALRNVDRVRAIEGVMAYNQLKEKLKPFFQQFAESGQAISAEDIKDYFAKLRGDEEGIRSSSEAAKKDNNYRQPQDGY